MRSARLLDIADSMPDGALEIARRSRGTPRIANRLLRRVRDFAEVKADGRHHREVADAALPMLDVDPVGLDLMDRKLLRCDPGQIRRRTGRRRQSFGRDRRRARHDRRRARTFSDPAGLPAAHAARPRRHPAGLPPLRPRRAGLVECCAWIVGLRRALSRMHASVKAPVCRSCAAYRPRSAHPDARHRPTTSRSPCRRRTPPR